MGLANNYLTMVILTKAITWITNFKGKGHIFGAVGLRIPDNSKMEKEMAKGSGNPVRKKKIFMKEST